MDVDGIAKLLDAIAKLLGALIWPIVIAYILVRFGPSIREFISSLGEFSLKAAGFEASAKRRQNEAAAALAAAAASQPQDGATPVIKETAAKEAAQAASNVSARTIRRIEGSRILWVDDRPQNNSYAKQALEAIGIRVEISLSTEDALDKISSKSFDVIISDMGRPPDPQAGYTLLDKIRGSGNNIPFIIYAGSRSPEHQAESRRRGAIGCTNRATELFEMVLSALMS